MWACLTIFPTVEPDGGVRGIDTTQRGADTVSRCTQAQTTHWLKVREKLKIKRIIADEATPWTENDMSTHNALVSKQIGVGVDWPAVDSAVMPAYRRMLS